MFILQGNPRVGNKAVEPADQSLKMMPKIVVRRVRQKSADAQKQDLMPKLFEPHDLRKRTAPVTEGKIELQFKSKHK